MRCRIRSGAALVLALATGMATRAVGQVTELAARGPRFLAVSTSGGPRVDASNALVLRRRVSFRVTNVTVKAALEEVGRRAKLRFLYSDDLVHLDRQVSVEAKHLTLAAVLTEILIGTGLDVLVLPDGQLGLVQKAADAPGQFQGGTVTGQVKDGKSGEPISGADVFLEGTNWRASSGKNGWFRLSDVDTGSYTLVVRRLGYTKQSQRVAVREGQEDTVHIMLEPAAAKLDELVTTATGRQRRRDLGNDITTIRADSVLQHAPIRTLTDLLENRVPGLTVQHTTGAPGDPAKLRLRGLGSAFRSNDPVVVVDGVRVYAAQSEARSGNLTNALGQQLSGPHGTDLSGNPVNNGTPAPSPLDQIDPNIIETIEVFKGPSAATMYGADAANGVIVITTKRGKPGPTRWNASLTHGRTTQPGRYPTGYYRWGHDSLGGDRIFCPVTNLRCVQDSLTLFQALNERALTIFGTGQRTSLSLTASGGTQALTYSITGSYGTEIGLLKLPDYEVRRFDSLFNREAPDWMRRPHRYDTWGVTSNVTARLSATADVTLSTALSRSEQQRTSLENQAAALMGTYVDTINGLYYQPGGIGNYALGTTAAILHDYYVHTTASAITVTTGLQANWRPRSWFTAAGNAGLNIGPREDQLFLPAGLLNPTDSGTLVRGTGRTLQSTFDLRGELRRPLGHGFIFTTSVGANLTTATTNDFSSSATGLVPGTSSLSAAQGLILATDSRTNTSVFGWYIEPRIAGERLSLSTGLRLDGGSSYGARITRSGGGLGGLLALPKLNGSWVISEEPFFPRAFSGVISSLRLRGAYGQAQVQPSALDRLRIYSRPAALGGLLTLSGVGNTHLKPERSTEFEAGFDADLLDSRVSLELSTYRKMQVDALMPLTLPGSVNGGGTVTTNIGNIKNTGVELTVGLTPVRLPALTWSARLNFNRNRNLLTKLGDGVAPQPSQGLVEGYPVHSRWALPILGFVDANNDGVLQRSEIQVGDSMVYLGRLLPDYTSTLATDVTLFGGAVGVSAGFSYDAGAAQINQTALTNWILSRALADPSAPPSDLAAIVAYSPLCDGSGQCRGASLLSPATDYGLMQTISTFRFNSLSVNYRAPQRVARLLRADQLTVALQGSNLGLHSSYRGKDPDVNAWSPGEQVVDMGQLPQPRTWQLAVFLQY